MPIFIQVSSFWRYRHSRSEWLLERGLALNPGRAVA
jgi:hypothetical protein